MLKLHALENTELSPYCLISLEKHGITLIREFNIEKPEKLMKILNINFEQLEKIKAEFRRLYSPKQYFHEDLISDNSLRKKVYGTYIENLDEMMSTQEQFNSLSFWEICGPAGVGKTQLAFTLMLNFVINQVKPALFIDTKLDFSANRIKNMLEAREIDPDLYAGVMSFMKVERVLSAQGVVEMLETFHKQLQQGNKDVNLIKMIVIDSLPSAWFLLKADNDRLCGKWLLSRLSQIINRLVRQHYISVVCVNLSLVPNPEENLTKLVDTINSNNDNDVSDLIEADDREIGCEISTSLGTIYQPVLGKFWLSKPHTRLSLEFPDKNDIKYKEDSSLRVIKLIYTRFSPGGLSCSVRLQPEGFV